MCCLHCLHLFVLHINRQAAVPICILLLLACSKKLRVPGLNTELLRLTLTTGWGHTESQGLLNKLFNFSLAFSTDSIKLANPKVPEQFSASFHPKFGLPAGVFRTLRIPGNLYLKVSMQAWALYPHGVAHIYEQMHAVCSHHAGLARSKFWHSAHVMQLPPFLTPSHRVTS